MSSKLLVDFLEPKTQITSSRIDPRHYASLSLFWLLSIPQTLRSYLLNLLGATA